MSELLEERKLTTLEAYPFISFELTDRFKPKDSGFFLGIPDLLRIQKETYDRFLQVDVPRDRRENVGIHRVLSSLYFEKGRARLEYVDYQLEPPKYKPEECKARELTYASIMRVKLRLTIFEDEKREKIKEIREDWVYFGEIPRMTPKCSFIINGTEKVIVNQLHKSPGVYFEYDKYKVRTTSKFVPIARIIPYRGMWIDFDFDLKDILYVRLQKRKRINAWIFLKALGLELEDLLGIYEKEEILIKKGQDGKIEILKEIKPDVLKYQLASMDYWVGGKKIEKGTRLIRSYINMLLQSDVVKEIDGKLYLPISEDELDIAGKDSKERKFGTRVISKSVDGANVGDELTPELVRKLAEMGVEKVETIWYDDVFVSGSIIKTYKEMVKKYRVSTSEEAAVEFFRKTHPGEPTDPRAVMLNVRAMFMSTERFNLSRVGRIRIAKKFDLEEPIRIIVRPDGAFKEVNERFAHFWVATADIELGDEKIHAGQRIRNEHIKKMKERGVKFIPISYSELFDFAPCEDLKDGRGNIIVPARRNIDKIALEKIDKVVREEGREIEFRAYWYPESLTYIDIFEVIKYLFELRSGKAGRFVDDVDNLANRRVRPVGELVEMEMVRGLERIRRSIEEKLGHSDIEDKSLKDIVNFKPAASALKEFFAMGQLVQFLDNTNPLSELTHKRRLSALGTGGLKRETAGIEARDVHSSHYGKICPVETPEGQNVGLITSMSIFSKVDELGLLQTPYRKVVDGRVENKIEFLSALDEERVPIAPFGVEIDRDGRILVETLPARVGTEIKLVKREDVKYMDAVPFQILGVSASLIPFFEHDDSNRALMGSNMQRQAVPLLFTEPPLVGVGHEKEVAKNALAVVTAEHAGIVKYLDAERIVIEVDDPDYPELKGTADIYTLTKWDKTNQSTSINQRPLVRLGERVRRGQVIADGHATAGGELALGKNVLVAIMSWRGYNFEDSIVISERLVYDDVYTSVHIEELSVDVRETRYGPEEVTRDIPGVSPELSSKLDEDGIVRPGVYVNPGDILVGKITPVAEVSLTPEERLIKSIFGKAIENIKDTSLRCPPDIKGIVLSVYVHYRKNIVKDKRIREQEEEIISKIKKDMDDSVEILRGKLWERMGRYINSIRILKGVKIDKETFNENTQAFREAFISKLKGYKDIANMKKYVASLANYIDDESRRGIIDVIDGFMSEEQTLKKIFEEKIAEVRRGEELPPGVLKRIRIRVASKRKIQVGDKLSGRHGNKGVISVILPQEDMPFLPDGTPVDIILSPLGIPSRMNVGQLFELQLGWVSKELGKKISDIVQKLKDEYISKNAKEIRQKIKSILANGEDKTGVISRFFSYVDSLSDEQLLKFVREAEKIGVRFAVPPFEGIGEEEIKELGKKLGIPETFAVKLRDGRTGEEFDLPVAIGYMYIMKLIHMVEDKIHARSTGTYSLITQQPLGGKSRGGGQRFGEMEVWALEAYGASYTLQEMLTVKADDVTGRGKTIHSMIEGKNVYSPSVPESFLVLIKELQAMGFDIELLSKRDLEEIKMQQEEEEEQIVPKVLERARGRGLLRRKQK